MVPSCPSNASWRHQPLGACAVFSLAVLLFWGMMQGWVKATVGNCHCRWTHAGNSWVFSSHEEFLAPLYLSVILISSAGCCCSTDSHLPPHILTGPSSAWTEGWSACFPVPGDVQFHTALQVTASCFPFLVACSLMFLMCVYIHQTPHTHLPFPLCSNAVSFL